MNAKERLTKLVSPSALFLTGVLLLGGCKITKEIGEVVEETRDMIEFKHDSMKAQSREAERASVAKEKFHYKISDIFMNSLFTLSATEAKAECQKYKKIIESTYDDNSFLRNSSWQLLDEIDLALPSNTGNMTFYNVLKNNKRLLQHIISYLIYDEDFQYPALEKLAKEVEKEDTDEGRYDIEKLIRAEGETIKRLLTVLSLGAEVNDFSQMDAETLYQARKIMYQLDKIVKRRVEEDQKLKLHASSDMDQSNRADILVGMFGENFRSCDPVELFHSTEVAYMQHAKAELLSKPSVRKVALDFADSRESWAKYGLQVGLESLQYGSSIDDHYTDSGLEPISIERVNTDTALLPVLYKDHVIAYIDLSLVERDGGIMYSYSVYLRDSYNRRDYIQRNPTDRPSPDEFLQAIWHYELSAAKESLDALQDELDKHQIPQEVHDGVAIQLDYQLKIKGNESIEIQERRPEMLSGDNTRNRIQMNKVTRQFEVSEVCGGKESMQASFEDFEDAIQFVRAQYKVGIERGCFEFHEF